MANNIIGRLFGWLSGLVKPKAQPVAALPVSSLADYEKRIRKLRDDVKLISIKEEEITRSLQNKETALDEKCEPYEIGPVKITEENHRRGGMALEEYKLILDMHDYFWPRIKRLELLERSSAIIQRSRKGGKA